MPLHSAVLATFFALAASTSAAAEEPLRLENLKRCGDLLENRQQDWCLEVRGLGDAMPQLKLAGKSLPSGALQRDGNQLRLRLDSVQHQSGPLWLEDGARRSNAAWLTLRNSHVVAATPAKWRRTWTA